MTQINLFSQSWNSLENTSLGIVNTCIVVSWMLCDTKSPQIAKVTVPEVKGKNLKKAMSQYKRQL
jgi:hypothetical protein